MAPSPPPPTLFLPDTCATLVAAASDCAENERLYAWGVGKGETRVVVGVLSGKTVDEVEERLRTKLGSVRGGKKAEAERESGVRVLAKVRRVEADATTSGSFPGFDLLPLPSPTPASSAPPCTPVSSSRTSTVQVVLYSPLRHLEVLSLEPLQLDFHPQPRVPARPTSAVGGERNAGVRRSRGEGTLEEAVKLINSTPALLSSASPTPSRIARLGLDFLPSLFAPFLLVLNAVLSVAVSILSYKVPLVGSFAERTTFGRQLHTRFSQALSLAPTYTAFRRQLHGSPSTIRPVEGHQLYIRFFNLLWLLANDLIIGFALSSFLREIAGYFASVLEVAIQDYALSSLRGLLEWLNSWPLGVKLNDELAGLICAGFLFLTRVWEDLILLPLLPHLPTLLRFVSLSGYLGASSLLAFSSDLLSLLAVPFSACYVLATVSYRWSARALGALFNVFRGKKYNPLRARVEPASYAVDALLLGTILFVTLAFLFPTIVAFYLAFFSARLAILTLYTLLTLGIAALNAFPLFALMLRIKAPGRLPGGIQLAYCEDGRCWKGPHTHLRNQPLSFVAILSSLSQVLSDVLNLSSVGRFLARVLTGHLV